MSMKKLFSHLTSIIYEKNYEASAWPDVRRQYMLDMLSAEGLTNLENYTNEELRTLLREIPISERKQKDDIWSSPQPDPYILRPCYGVVFYGLGEFQARSYRTSTQGIEVLGPNDDILYLRDYWLGGMIEILPRALWFIGKKDPVICDLATCTDLSASVTLEFGVTDSQLQEFRTLYEEFRAEMKKRREQEEQLLNSRPALPTEKPKQAKKLNWLSRWWQSLSK